MFFNLLQNRYILGNDHVRPTKNELNLTRFKDLHSGDGMRVKLLLLRFTAIILVKKYWIRVSNSSCFSGKAI